MKKILFMAALLLSVAAYSQINVTRVEGIAFDGQSTATLNGLGTKVLGDLYLDTDLGYHVWWNGSAFVSVGGAGGDGLGPDGDKGDITVGGTGTTLAINDQAVTSAKIANGTIVGEDISNGGIAAAKFETTNSPQDGYIYTYDQPSGGGTWEPNSGGGGGDVSSVTDIAAMLAIGSPTEGQTVVVRESIRGGVFRYVSASSGTNDGGVIISGWTRIATPNVINVGWFGNDGAALQAAIDYLEGLSSPTATTLNIDVQVSQDQNVTIAGSTPMVVNGTGGEIIQEFPGYTLNVGSSAANTSAEIIFNDVEITDAGQYSTNLAIINHRRFRAFGCNFNQGSSGVKVLADGNNHFSYDITFTGCEFDSNTDYGVHIHSLNATTGNFANLISFYQCYITDNGTQMRIENTNAGTEVSSIYVSGTYFDNGVIANDLIELVDTYNNFFVANTYDSVDGGADDIVIDAASFDNTFAFTRYIDGTVSNLGTRTKFDRMHGRTFINSSRNMGTSDIGGTVMFTGNYTLTIPLDFSDYQGGTVTDVYAPGHSVSIAGATGVTVNGTAAGSKSFGDGTEYVYARVVKTGANAYHVYPVDIGSGGGGGGIATSDQINSRGTAIYDNTLSSDIMSYRQEGTELMRIGGNNDQAVYVAGLESLSGNTIPSISPIMLAARDIASFAATDYDHAILRDANSPFLPYYSDGTNWLKLTIGDVPDTLIPFGDSNGNLQTNTGFNYSSSTLTKSGSGLQEIRVESTGASSAIFRMKNTNTEWHFQAGTGVLDFVESGVGNALRFQEGTGASILWFRPFDLQNRNITNAGTIGANTSMTINGNAVLASDISTGTNRRVPSNLYVQDEADLITDGTPATDAVVFCSNCAPSRNQTATTFAVDRFRSYDDRAVDAGTFTFNTLKTGASVLIEINRATDATYSGITFAHTTGAFAANTRQLVTIFILPSGDAYRDYKDLE